MIAAAGAETRALILYFILGSVLASAADFEPIAFTTSDNAIETGAATGDRLLSGKEMMVNRLSPSGKLAKGDILVLFDQPTGLFYWHYWDGRRNEAQPGLAADLRLNAKFYVTNEKIVVFLVGYPQMGVRDSFGTHPA
jgi:hypothetical protein